MTGAPKGNRNAETHGGYSRPGEIRDIADAVEDLEHRLTKLTHYLDTAGEETMLPALALYGQMISRYGRLLRDQKAISGDSIDNILDAMGVVAEEIGTQLGWKIFEG